VLPAAGYNYLSSSRELLPATWYEEACSTQADLIFVARHRTLHIYLTCYIITSKRKHRSTLKVAAKLFAGNSDFAATLQHPAVVCSVQSPPRRRAALLHASSGSSAAQYPPSRACGAEHGG
jgi:hypothetical protein